MGELRRLPTGDGCVQGEQSECARFLLPQRARALRPCSNTLLPVPHSRCIPGDVLQPVCWGSALHARFNVSAHSA